MSSRNTYSSNVGNYKKSWNDCIEPQLLIEMVSKDLTRFEAVKIACFIARSVSCFAQSTLFAIESAEIWLAVPSSENCDLAMKAWRAAWDLSMQPYTPRFFANSALAAAYAAKAVYSESFARDVSDAAMHSSLIMKRYLRTVSPNTADARLSNCNYIRSVIDGRIR